MYSNHTNIFSQSASADISTTPQQNLGELLPPLITLMMVIMMMKVMLAVVKTPIDEHSETHAQKRLLGRAASPIRPGLLIKEVLEGRTPLASGEFITEASISDLYKAYKHRVLLENQQRDRKHRLQGMSYDSFNTTFRFARYLGLVEPTGVIKGNHKMYRLTAEGIADDTSWLNLCKAWREWRANKS